MQGGNFSNDEKYMLHDHWLRSANVLIQVTESTRKDDVRAIVYAYEYAGDFLKVKQTFLLEAEYPTLVEAKEAALAVATAYLRESADLMVKASFTT